MTTRTYKQLSLAVAVLLGLRCRPVAAEHAHTAAKTAPPAKRLLAQHVAQTAPPGAVNCGIGQDVNSDAAVYNCGSNSLAHQRPFYAVFLPWAGPASDIVTSPTQLAIAFVADDTPAITAVEEVGPSEFRSTRVWRRNADSAAPIRPLRGMHLPRFVSAGPISPQPHHTAIVELAITADGRVADARVVKSISKDTDRDVIEFVSRSLTDPARLFGVGVSVILTVAVDDVNGTFIIRDSADR
jgi:hypothetical protein